MAKTCSKCGRTIPESNFWKMKNKEHFHMCKDCLLQEVDDRDPETFLWILEGFDVPYVEGLWQDIAVTAYNRDPIKYNHKTSVLGRYIRSGNMKPWRQWGWKDTDKANEYYIGLHGVKKEVSEEAKQELKKQLEAGEISEAEFNARTSDVEEPVAYSEPVGASALGYNKKLKMPEPATTQDKTQQVAWEMPMSIKEREQKLKDDLTEEDMLYLAAKWGTNWRPSEWIALEQMYTAYADEYELNVDRENTLRQICKTSVKMDQALENDDIQTYKSLAQAQDQLRKSAKFTEMQNKEGTNADAVSSIGQLVAMIEKAGSIIPQKQYTINYEPDIVDMTLQDTQRYLATLVRNEMGLGDIIESYIEKLEKAQESDDTEMLKIDLSKADEDTQNEAYARAYALALEGNVDQEIAQMMEGAKSNGT